MQVVAYRFVYKTKFNKTIYARGAHDQNTILAELVVTAVRSDIANEAFCIIVKRRQGRLDIGRSDADLVHDLASDNFIFVTGKRAGHEAEFESDPVHMFAGLRLCAARAAIETGDIMAMFALKFSRSRIGIKRKGRDIIGKGLLVGAEKALVRRRWNHARPFGNSIHKNTAFYYRGVRQDKGIPPYGQNENCDKN